MPGVKKATTNTRKKVKPDPIIIPESEIIKEDDGAKYEGGDSINNENVMLSTVSSPPPAPKKRASRKKIIPDVNEETGTDTTNTELPKQMMNDVASSESCVNCQESNTNNPVSFSVDKHTSSSHIYLYDFPKTVELMEKVKSKVEMLNKEEHLSLMKSIFTMFHDRLSRRDGVEPLDARRKAFEELRSQVTQNQNGIFLNLTTCSNHLWQSCYSCIHILERQHTDFERLDKERQNEIEQMVQNI